jgi:hypothetical protein
MFSAMPKGSGFYCIVDCIVREGVGLKFGVKIANFQKFEENAGEACGPRRNMPSKTYTSLIFTYTTTSIHGSTTPTN